MVALSQRTMHSYGRFESHGPDPEHWEFLDIPLGGDDQWRCEEPSAATSVSGGTLEVRVERFERSHDGVQILDNPKHLLLSTREFRLSPESVVSFSVDMAAESIGGDASDYRDGFAAFNVLDMGSGLVWDHVATGTRTYAIHEQLLIPGVIAPEDAFTWVVEDPLSGLDIRPGDLHQYTVTLDGAGRRARWFVDGRPVFEVRELALPPSVRIGFGLITLHPIAGGVSTSLRGQGMTGRWRDFRFSVNDHTA